MSEFNIPTREQIDRLADLWHVPAEVRSAASELEQEILAAPKLVAAEHLVSDAIRDSLAFENDMPRGHPLVQIANRASHLLFQQGVIAPESPQPVVDRDAVESRLTDALIVADELVAPGYSARIEADADDIARVLAPAVLALLNGGAS